LGKSSFAKTQVVNVNCACANGPCTRVCEFANAATDTEDTDITLAKVRIEDNVSEQQFAKSNISVESITVANHSSASVGEFATDVHCDSEASASSGTGHSARHTARTKSANREVSESNVNRPSDHAAGTNSQSG